VAEDVIYMVEREIVRHQHLQVCKERAMFQRFFLSRLIGVPAAVVLLSVMFVPALGADETATSLPRYKLEVGQQIRYEGSGEGKYDDGRKSRTDEHWEFDVLGRSADSNYRMLYRLVQKRTEIAADGKEQASDPSVEFALMDINQTGNMTELFGSFGYRSSPRSVFPPLPADAKQMTEGWQGSGSLGSTMHYQMLPESNAKEFVFSIDEESTLNIIYDSERTRMMTFDYERGLPTKCTDTYKQGWKIKMEGGSEFKLIDVQMHDADWAAKLADDAVKFFVARQKFNKATDAEDATPESFDQAIAELKSVKGVIQTPEFQQQLDQALDDFQKYRHSTEEDLKERKVLLGQAAEDFKTTDLNGMPQSLSDYRGKVVLLDFWYRGCGWCIRAMPALKNVADHYQGKPVILLGMNTDQDVADAKFVEEKMGLNYTNLKAGELPKKFKVSGFPTMILIDQQGTVRYIHCGWSATLEQDLIEKIDRLLAEAK
jgi:thiol-disulfide isomerase/thioredoxin